MPKTSSAMPALICFSPVPLQKLGHLDGKMASIKSLKLVCRAADRETGRRRSLLASGAIIREALFLAKAPRERLTDLPSSQNALGGSAAGEHNRPMWTG